MYNLLLLHLFICISHHANFDQYTISFYVINLFMNSLNIYWAKTVPGNVLDTGAVVTTTTDPAPALMEFTISQGKENLTVLLQFLVSAWQSKSQALGLGSRSRKASLRIWHLCWNIRMSRRWPGWVTCMKVIARRNKNTGGVFVKAYAK